MQETIGKSKQKQGNSNPRSANLLEGEANDVVTVYCKNFIAIDEDLTIQSTDQRAWIINTNESTHAIHG